jgi:hypothetical protein
MAIIGKGTPRCLRQKRASRTPGDHEYSCSPGSVWHASVDELDQQLRAQIAADLRGRCFEPLIRDSGTDRAVLCAYPWLNAT